MKIKYKIALVVVLVNIITLFTISLVYNDTTHEEILSLEKNKLSNSVHNGSHWIELELNKRLDITKTIATAPMVVNTLLKSNKQYRNLSKNNIKNKINNLNEKWKKLRTTNDPFIISYLTNPLAKFLKNQQNILPNVYGEIFITNVYGTIVATTGKLSTLAHANKYWWKDAFNNGDGLIFFDDRGFDDSVKGYVIGITIPIKKDGIIIGILKANVNILGSLQHVIDEYNNLNHGEMKIVRTKGLIVVDKNKKPLSKSLNQNIIKYIQSMKNGAKIIDKSLVAYTPIAITLSNTNIKFGGKPKSSDHLYGNKNEAWHIIINYPLDDAMISMKNTKHIIIITAIIVSFVLLIISLILGYWISLPIKNLSDITYRIQKGNYNLRVNKNSNDEIGKLSQSFNKMLQVINSTTISRDKLTVEIEQRKKVEQQLRDQEEIVIAQSKNAAMGEMISIIAHQWRQPLSIISLGANNILADIELESLDDKTLQENALDIIKQTQELSKTIDDFKNFFKPDKKSEIVLINDVVEETLKIIGKSLENNTININIDYHTNIKIKTYKRELIQVLLNIINNAKDAIIQNNKNKDRLIDIIIDKNDKYIDIKICDNGGGISNDNITKIFNPYFTTKSDLNGTGLGLYISKTIIEKHMNGLILVSNSDVGACFIIKLDSSYKVEEN